MKKLILTALLVTGSLGAQAGGFRFYHHWGFRSPAVSFYFGASPDYWPYYSWGYYPAYAYGYYPSYSYAPAYSYNYGYARPNYAVSGTLLGALTGGLIGNSIHHQGWEGAGIGAAAGLLLGSLAENNARVREQTYYAAPPVSYARPNYTADAPTVPNAPRVPSAPQIQNFAATYKPASAMSSANRLFGR